VNYFDDNNWSEISEENLRYFYEEFSNDVRRRLLSKNLISPNDVYEVLYPQTKTYLLAKNIPKITDLENSSAFIREALLAKTVSESASLEKLSEDTRKSLLARNKITTEADQLLQKSLVVRDDLLSKNTSSKNDLLKDSDSFRDKNISQGKPKANAQFEADANNDSFREKNITANLKKTTDIEDDSKVFRENNTSLNVNNTSDVERDSSSFRDKNISANVEKVSDIESESIAFRNKNISNNIVKKTDLEEDSKSALKNNISLNVPSSSDLETDSNKFRGNNVSSNVTSTTDLEADSESFRRKNITNNVESKSDLESDSKTFREKNISKIAPSVSDIESDSKEIRDKNISLNTPTTSDLEKDSKAALKNNTSLNTPTTSDLEKDSKAALKNNISLNTPTTSDLEKDSKAALKNNTSLNTPTTSDLEKDSKVALKNNTSLNTPTTSDIASDSVPFYTNNTSANVPSTSDIASDSVPFYNNNVSANVPSTSDLENDSVPFYNNNVSANVPSTSDLETDSVPYYNSNIAPNVPNNEDLEKDSVPFRKQNLASNVPHNTDLLNDSKAFLTNNVSANVPDGGDLLNDSEKYFKNNVSANVPSISDIEKDSIVFRNDLLSTNVPQITSLENLSSQFRKANLSKNPPSKQLGVVVEGIGTSAFLGVSNVLLQGALLRQILLTKNRKGKLSIDQFAQEMRKANDVESQAHFLSIHTPLQRLYGNESPGDFQIIPSGDFVFNGSITDAIRNFNISRNAYNISNIQPFNSDYYNVLQSNTSEGFQALLASNPNSFTIRNVNFSQLAPTGNYTYKNPEDVFRATELMSKTTPGNPLMDEEFQAGTKGVLGIIRKIRDSKESTFAKNFDVQNQHNFVVGRDGSKDRVSRQRYTIANPYSAGNAEKVLFYIQNFSSGDGFYFPPYIQDYSESFGANWNTLNYLGRPESIYTYNNSSREGTITFVVLTDYSNDVLLGTNFSDANMQPIKLTKTDLKDIHFTNKDNKQNQNKKFSQSSIEQSLAKKEQLNGDIKTQAINNRDIKNLQKQVDSLTKSINNSFVGENKDTNYSESNKNMINVYNGISSNANETNDSKLIETKERINTIDSKLIETKERINTMVKNLAFQPAFFSGDKVDFVTKMDFLGKLTRPSSAKGNSGFSFTRPPVCHIKLGDWWDSDIIIDSVSFNMTNAPWTLDSGRVQPMWATVSINFKFVGSYGSSNGSPVLSDDVHGFYAPKGTKSSSLE